MKQDLKQIQSSLDQLREKKSKKGSRESFIDTIPPPQSSRRRGYDWEKRYESDRGHDAEYDTRFDRDGFSSRARSSLESEYERTFEYTRHPRSRASTSISTGTSTNTSASTGTRTSSRRRQRTASSERPRRSPREQQVGKHRTRGRKQRPFQPPTPDDEDTMYYDRPPRGHGRTGRRPPPPPPPPPSSRSVQKRVPSEVGKPRRRIRKDKKKRERKYSDDAFDDAMYEEDISSIDDSDEVDWD